MKLLIDAIVYGVVFVIFVFIVRGYHRKKTGVDD